MNESGLTIDSIEWSDIEGSNSSLIMRTFVESCKKNPPIHRNGSQPYDDKTVTKAFSAGIRKIRQKFSVQIGNDEKNKNGDYFPADEQDSCRQQLKRDRSRNLMEGVDDSDLWKTTYPLPRKQGKDTQLLQVNNIPTTEFMEAYRMIDFYTVCCRLFARGEYKKLLELIATFSAIGRAGEAKFLHILNMFYDSYFGLLFCQWFQKKTCKSNPTAFVPDYQHPEKCFYFSHGCFFACEDGLFRPNGIGEPKSAKRRRAYFLFQELHGIHDTSVAGRITGHIRSVVGPPVCTLANSCCSDLGTLEKRRQIIFRCAFQQWGR